MLHFNRTDISTGIDVKKTNESKDCIICHQWFFLVKGFTFQADVCNGCHEVLMISMNPSNVAILSFNGADHACISNGVSENEAMSWSKNAVINKKSRSLKGIKCCYHA